LCVDVGSRVDISEALQPLS